MKLLLTILALLLTLTVFSAENNAVMLFIHAKNFKPSDSTIAIIRGNIEEIATKNQVTLVDEVVQTEVLKEQAKQRKTECYEESCVVDVGKMIAANKILKIEITKGNTYIFNGSFIDIEKGLKENSKQDIYSGDINDDIKLAEFSKKFAKKVMNDETDSVITASDSANKNNSSSSKSLFTSSTKITIKTNPSEAEVYDVESGTFLGKTPLEIDKSKNITDIKIVKENYKYTQEFLNYTKGNEFSFDLVDKTLNQVTINSNVDAKLYVNNELKGVTPFKGYFKSGVYSLKFKTGMQDVFYDINVVKDNEIFNINIFDVLIKTGIESDVYIGGEFKGKTPLSLKLTNKTYEFVFKTKLGEFKKYIDVTKNETFSFNFGQLLNVKVLIDKYEVTADDFEKCVKANKCKLDNIETHNYYANCNYGDKKKGKHPMNCVSLTGASEYCAFIGKRLPTNEEWEIAALGGEKYNYAGSDDVSEVAWYNLNSENTTHEVGGKNGNGFGLYDMSGNVFEITSTCRTTSCEEYIIRGGSFIHKKDDLILSTKGFLKDYLKSYFIGFRCIKNAE